AIIVVIIIVAASGSYFLLFNKGSTSSQSTTSTHSSSSTSSSNVTTQSGSQISTSVTSTSSSTTSSLIHSRYNLPFSSSNHTVFIFFVTQRNVTSEENYNLTNFGAMKIYVPLDWNISLRIYNNQSTPHNVMIVQNTTDVPTAANVGTQGNILFAVGNQTDNYQFSGVPGGQEAQGVYTNNARSGVYWLTCGVRDHGGSGMWAILVVSSNVTVPYVVVTNPTLTPSSV
ncbi:MAG: quinol oxidase subunit 2, partial [Nitrososphaerota archaeon]|nr:quinol oxidase subunit 2 [Nitrososphaerota archaeon]